MRNPSVVRSKVLRQLSMEGQAIVSMLVEAMNNGHTVKSQIGRFWKATLKVVGHSKPQVKLTIVRCDESNRLERGRTITTPIHDWRDPLTVAVRLEKRAFPSAGQVMQVKSAGSGSREGYYRANRARVSSH